MAKTVHSEQEIYDAMIEAIASYDEDLICIVFSSCKKDNERRVTIFEERALVYSADFPKIHANRDNRYLHDLIAGFDASSSRLFLEL